MISFKEYLTEARAAPLYHSTFIYNANKILDDDTLYGSVQTDGATKGKKVIFLTRSFKHAQAIYSTMDTVIFELDQAKLSQRYRIRPIKNWLSDQTDKNHKPMYMTKRLGGNEFEEIIETDRIDYIDRYIKKIYVKSGTDMSRYPYLHNDERVVYY